MKHLCFIASGKYKQMHQELDVKLSRLEDNIRMLTVASEPDQKLVSDINAQMAVFESLVEFYKLPAELIARYNIARLTYAQVFDSLRIYCSTDRAVRIAKIARDVEHVVDAQEFMRACLESQGADLDALNANMAAGEATTDLALNEMNTHRTRVISKMKVWRYATILVGGLIMFGVYRVVFS